MPGSKIHVRRQRNRCSASGEVLAALQRKAVLLHAFSSAPLVTTFYSSSEGGCMASSSHPYGSGIADTCRYNPLLLQKVGDECDHKDIAEFVLATSDDARGTDGKEVRCCFPLDVSICVKRTLLKPILMREPCSTRTTIHPRRPTPPPKGREEKGGDKAPTSPSLPHLSVKKVCQPI